MFLEMIGRTWRDFSKEKHQSKIMPTVLHVYLRLIGKRRLNMIQA